jgi:hypothetical protein
MAGLVGLYRLRAELDEDAGFIRIAKDDQSAILDPAIFHVVQGAVGSIERALVHMHILDAGEAGRRHGAGSMIGRSAGAEHRDHRLALCGRLERTLQVPDGLRSALPRLAGLENLRLIGFFGLEFERLDDVGVRVVKTRQSVIFACEEKIRRSASLGNRPELSHQRQIGPQGDDLVLDLGRVGGLVAGSVDGDAIGRMVCLAGLNNQQPVRPVPPRRAEPDDFANQQSVAVAT